MINKELENEYYEWLDKTRPLNCGDSLLSNSKTSKKIEWLADELLKQSTVKYEKVQYKFYTDEAEFIRKTKNEVDISKYLDFLIANDARDYKKYRLDKKLIITDDDKKREYIKDYSKMMNVCTNIRMNKDLKMDMILSKESLDRPIYFKHVTEGTCETDWYLFNFENREHVKALLQNTGNVGSNEWIGTLVCDLEKLMTTLTDKEKTIIDLWKSGYTQQEIADKYNVAQQAIIQSIDLIINKICNEYKKSKQEWLYTNILRGKYKTCISCNEPKLESEYYNDNRNTDNLRSQCKSCCKK